MTRTAASILLVFCYVVCNCNCSPEPDMTEEDLRWPDKVYNIKHGVHFDDVVQLRDGTSRITTVFLHYTNVSSQQAHKLAHRLTADLDSLGGSVLFLRHNSDLFKVDHQKPIEVNNVDELLLASRFNLASQRLEIVLLKNGTDDHFLLRNTENFDKVVQWIVGKIGAYKSFFNTRKHRVTFHFEPVHTNQQVEKVVVEGDSYFTHRIVVGQTVTVTSVDEDVWYHAWVLSSAQVVYILPKMKSNIEVSHSCCQGYLTVAQYLMH